jgi:hypothetical protein
VDVTESVLARVKATPARRNVLLWAYAGISSAVAATVVGLVVQAVLERQDVVFDLMPPLMGVLP